MTKSQKTIITILAITAGLLLIAAGYFGVQAYQFYASQPLGPALPVSTQSQPATWTPTIGTPLISATQNTPTPQPLCGGPNVMTILAIGMDRYGDTDIIRVVRVDFLTPKVTVLEFPRDLWVEIPYIADNQDGLDHAKLNMAYFFGSPERDYWDDPSGGQGLLALTLDINFGVKADHYAVVDMHTFEEIVDAVGGIDINITDLQTVYNTGKPMGQHHLGGADALTLARHRKEGVFARASNQNLVLCALREKLLSPGVIPQIPQLINSFKDNIQTDFTPEQLGQLACLGTKLPLENIAFSSFPEELFKPSRIKPDPYFDNPKGTFVWDVDFDTLRKYVTHFNAGTWPGHSASNTDEEDTSSAYCP
jgi:LCP family protein required for cell wall assembly